MAVSRGLSKIVQSSSENAVGRRPLEPLSDCSNGRFVGMEVEGIFRRSPSSVLLRQAKEAYDRGTYSAIPARDWGSRSLTTLDSGQTVSLSAWGDPHIAAVLLKKFFRDLPEPLFYEEMFPVIRKCPIPTGSPGDMATINYLREQILPALRTDAAEIVFSYVLREFFASFLDF